MIVDGRKWKRPIRNTSELRIYQPSTTNHQPSTINHQLPTITSSFTIELRGLRFFATHGMYQEEAKVGNNFELDVIIVCPSPSGKINSIDQTVDYVEVYNIIQKEFAVRTSLLETAAIRIADRIHARFPHIDSVSISIRKLSPPITNFSGSVGINYTRTFK